MPHSQNEDSYFIHGDPYSQERLESMQQWICNTNIYKTAKQVIKSGVLVSTLCCVTDYKFRGQTKERFLGGNGYKLH